MKKLEVFIKDNLKIIYFMEEVFFLLIQVQIILEIIIQEKKMVKENIKKKMELNIMEILQMEN